MQLFGVCDKETTMGKMKELDQLFRDIGDDIFDDNDFINGLSPLNDTKVTFKENHNGYNYFWEKAYYEFEDFNEDETAVTEETCAITQFAILIDFTNAQFKCLHKGWEIYYKNKQWSDPYNEWEHIIEKTDFNTFVDALYSYLMGDDSPYEGYTVIHNTELAFQLRKIQQKVNKEE